MNSRMEQHTYGGFLNIRNAWMEGKAPMPTVPVSLFESNFNNLLGVFLGGKTNIFTGPTKRDVQPLTIVNKQSGKVLEIENAPTNQSASAYQVTRSGEPNQLWFIKRAKFGNRIAVPGTLFREAHRYWPAFLRFPSPGYSLVAANSGLCLDFLSSLPAGSDRLQHSHVSGPSTRLWAFIPDRNGYNFIFNLCSGRVLDVVDGSTKNYAPVNHHPFNGADSQRWQLLTY